MPKFSVKWGEEGVLKFALSSDYASEEWLTIFPQMAKTVGAHFSGNRQEVFFKFKN